MSRAYVAADLRGAVAVRAEWLCEYCLIHEQDTFFGCEVDHIVSEKHGGTTDFDNLAYACVYCNRYKGSDLGSVVPGADVLVRFYNPRVDAWNQHFSYDPVTQLLLQLTSVGDVTCRIFCFNHLDRIEERAALVRAGRYPSVAAVRRIGQRQ